MFVPWGRWDLAVQKDRRLPCLRWIPVRPWNRQDRGSHGGLSLQGVLAFRGDLEALEDQRRLGDLQLRPLHSLPAENIAMVSNGK